MNHELFMQRCLDLASKAQGHVSPNPMVGCVIVGKENRVIGEGYHQRFGEAHAEVNAILSVLDKTHLKDATLYVSLEPCNHYGKTPPCSDLIISSGLKRVVIASLDPNPLVAGKGIEKLIKNGIDVVTGILDLKNRNLNAPFFTFHTLHRPYWVLKWAETANRKMGNSYYKESIDRKISGETAQRITHKWRSELDAILIGVDTANTDNPLLNCRFWPGRNPKIILIDPNLRADKSLKLFESQESIYILNGIKDEIQDNIHFKKIDFSNWSDQLNTYLINEGIQSVLVEGGSKTLQHFIAENLWDECRVFTNENSKNWDVPSPEIHGELVQQLPLGSDQLNIYRRIS